MPRRSGTFAVALTGFLSWTGSAAADPCAGVTALPPQVKVDLKSGPVEYHTDRTREEIAAVKGRSAGAGSTSSWKPIGLTVADIRYSTRIGVKAVAKEGSRVCAALTNVEATLGYDKLDVYIVKNFKPGSCPYQVIYEHENKHVVIFKNTVARYGPLLRYKIESEARILRPVAASSLEQAARMFKSKLHSKTQQLFRELNRALDRSNGALDTPRNYSLEQARCDKW